eukprot:COSAG02_NODE_3229_length_7139_cov_2.777273_4_plen_95_part_00
MALGGAAFTDEAVCDLLSNELCYIRSTKGFLDKETVMKTGSLRFSKVGDLGVTYMRNSSNKKVLLYQTRIQQIKNAVTTRRHKRSQYVDDGHRA